MQHAAELLQRMRERRVLVVGDIMLDEYMRGDVTRISPEAPVPVLEVTSQETRLGGAANTAANIAVLGGHTTLLGLVGEDDAALHLETQLRNRNIEPVLVADASRPTTRKTRLVAQGQQIVRLDHEKRHPADAEATRALCAAISANVTAELGALVISDYAKGAVTAAVTRAAIDAARAHGVPVVVDPKQRDFTVYRGATVITPNLSELEKAVPGGLRSHRTDDIAAAAAQLLPALEGTALLVTRSADGMSLYAPAAAPVHVPAMAKEVYDVTGAGDTVVATLALALAAKIAYPEAIALASLAAAISVSKRGTSTVSPAELLAAALGA